MDQERRNDTSVGARMRQGNRGWASWAGTATSAQPAAAPATPLPPASAGGGLFVDPAATASITHDAATGLPNLALFHDRLDGALHRAKRGAMSVGVLYLRVDTFALFALEHGPRAGDELMRTVAARVTSAVRTSDTVARVNADEIAVVLEGLHNASGAEPLARKISKAIAEPARLLLDADGSPLDLKPQASIGVAVWPLHGPSRHDLLLGAAAALRRASGGLVHLYSGIAEGPARAAARN